MTTRYWIVVASKDHVQRGVAAGFAQANHGKDTPLRRMRQGDGIIYYSPKTIFGQDDRCQCFTALGEIADETVYQAKLGENFMPFRRNVEFSNTHETFIVPLIPHLSFIKDKRRWGGVFRFGVLEIPATDFALIAEHMGVGESITSS